MKECYLSINTDSGEKLIKQLKESLDKGKKEFVITANSEIFMSSRKNKTIYELLTDKHNIVTADGISIVKTAKYYGINIKNKVTGVILSTKLLKYAKDNKLGVYIFGSKQSTLDQLKIKNPDINFLGLKNGYEFDVDEIKKDIIKKNPDLILVALGVPKQELAINEIIGHVKKGVFIGVGGSIDVISGCKKRAPLFMQKHNIEWLYRIIKEPKRIKRFLKNNVGLIMVAKKDSKRCKNEN